MNFRLKLLLAMMLVVAGATGTALYVSQQRVQATYQKLFAQLSHAKIESFTSLQETRLGALKDKSRELAQSVRLQAALHESDENDATNLYLVAKDELRELSDNTIYVFFDSQGRLLVPTQNDSRFNRFGGQGQFRKQFSFVGESLTNNLPQQVGMVGAMADGRWQLQQIIVTKVIDPVTQETLGALLLAFPVPDLVSGRNGSPSQTNSTTGIKFGIWLDGRIYSTEPIPEPHISDLERSISENLKQTEFLIWPDEPHRVFLQEITSGSGLPAAYQVCLYSLADFIADQHKLKIRILIFGALTLLGAFLISLVLTHGLSVPLRELVAGTNEIHRGNFAVKVRVRSRDDIGKLASSFNEMAEGLALKEKYRTVLNLVADEKVAKQLIDNQAALGGELREVSAIFCDVRGFTALTQNMPPEEVIEMLNEHMAVLARVVKQNNGVVDKFVGDALMAIFGAPISHGNDALDAAKCALSLVIEREKLNQTSKHKLRIGVGLATGKMVAGCMGSTDRLNYTVLGERVNLAARLCSSAKAGQVIIDQTTRERLGETISVAPLPELHLKGFSENVVAYELRSAENIRINTPQ
ncbi:MAG TPA: adenylate/guanylate cyclase domain-containing protein [Methylomirabilota bacterium]|nr:adenylate/guanylate cyclase domain-containing protein [Methylomirabilota bacterium]